MSDQPELSVADFFRFGSAAAAETVEQCIRMTEAGIAQTAVDAPDAATIERRDR